MMAMSLAWRLSGALLGALVPIVAAGATATVPKVTKARTSVSSRMDYGPFLQRIATQAPSRQIRARLTSCSHNTGK
jgi:hypothetical protein